MPLADAYGALLAQGAIVADPAQSQCAAKLGELSGRLARWRRRRGGLVGFLKRSDPETPKGLYIFGPVGRGKTMLMDLFYETTAFAEKRRAHFHEFMADVQDRLAAARQSAVSE